MAPDTTRPYRHRFRAGLGHQPDSGFYRQSTILPLEHAAARAVGLADGGAVCLRAQDGSSRCTEDAIDWRAPVKTAPVRWQEVDTRAAPMISWERLCADLHALRFLGQGANWLGVLVALAMSFLAISGTVVALSRPKKEHR